MTASRTWRHGPASAARAQLVLSTAALGVLSLALPVMTLQVYDRVLPNPDSGTLPMLVCGVAVAVVLECCLRLARAWVVGWNGAVYEHAVSQAAMDHVLSADVGKAGAFGAGAFLGRLTSVSRLKDRHSGFVLMTLTELAFVPFYLAVVFYIARDLAMIPFGLLLAASGVFLIQGRRLRAALEHRDQVDDSRYDYLIACLRGIHTVKAFALENLLSRRYERLQEKTGLASFRAAAVSTETFNTGSTLSHVMMAAVMGVGAVMALHGHITTGALIATLLLSGRLMQPVQRALVLWARWQDFALAESRVESIFALPARQQAETPAELPAPRGLLAVRGLCFGGQLRDVAFDLLPGQAMSISSRGIAGKTALLDIVSGLYAPDAGEILVDGLDIRAYPPGELPRRIGYLATEGVIFRGTIRDNMTCFGTIPEAQAQDIAALLGVDAEVARLPAGFDTVLQADGNDQVPPGLRQRIAMTRILAPRPKIILFDEADRALDRAGYSAVFSLLARLSRKTAMVLVSDDANITALAGTHYMLENGVLAEKPRRERRAM